MLLKYVDSNHRAYPADMPAFTTYGMLSGWRNGAKGKALRTCRLDEDEQSLFNYWTNNINVWQEWNTKEELIEKLLMYMIILTWNH